MKMLLVLLLITAIVVSGCLPPGSVRSPKEPNSPRPDDFLKCESDQDCTVTTYQLDTCCTFCQQAVSMVGRDYLEEWQAQNCKNPNSREGCFEVECPSANMSTIRCENNKCAVSHRS